MVRVGDRVDTYFGFGSVAGKEEHYGGKIVQWVVHLDDRSRWACSEITSTDPVFYAPELAVIDTANSPNMTSPATLSIENPD